MAPRSGRKPNAGGRRSGRTSSIPAPSHMVVAGVDVLVYRKRVKNMSLRVKAPDGRVEATVPLYVSDDRLRDFVIERIPWIQRTAERVRASKMAQAEGASKAEIES